MLRKPLFWILFAAASLVAAVLAARYFPVAFPIVSLDIRMDRQAALRAAREVAQAEHLGPAGYREAASFGLDEEVQTFVELEAGGKAAFARMLKGDFYAPYTWQVRHFTPGEPNETLVRFTPDGRPYGFVEKLAELAPGARIPADAARTIAERTAARWHVDLAAYRLIEQSQQQRPGPAGRLDHTFVYERSNQQIGEGRYRLRLVVSGDRPTALIHFVKVPEAFSRRYEEMRAANMAIGFGSSVAMLVLYVIGGGVIGIFFLLRQRYVLWRQPLAWAAFVALLQALVVFNEWPLAWMTYDTAIPLSSYVGERLALTALALVGMTLFFGLSFMAAESLSRRAFPHHPQLWRVWSRDAASSTPIVGSTVAGYLLVGLFFGYEVLLYFVATRVLHWWSPSEPLFHPNVLAAYLPWFSAAAPSFQAGFWEESLFRAVPLAGAALVGDRIGHRRLLVGIAFVVQAVVFGAGHAPYPNQPAYARMVELVLPSFLFAAVYLRWGLLPGIVLHFTYDLVWFALPLFVVTAPGIWVNRFMVVAIGLAPLWVVLGRRLQAGRWQELTAAYRNSAWQPPAAEGETASTESRRTAATAMTRASVAVLIVAGLAGLAAWLAFGSFRDPVPPLTVGRETAVRAARETVERHGVHVGERWHVVASVDNVPDLAHVFVWRTAGESAYRALLGTYLDEPRWNVRIMTFEGNVAERAEEWNVWISGSGSVVRVRHTLPEARPGAALQEAAARELAQATVKRQFGLDPARLREESAVPSKRPTRTDWTFTFVDKDTWKLPQGDLRVAVTITGDEVADAYRSVHVAEAFERAERNRQIPRAIMRAVSGLFVSSIMLAGAVAALISWTRKRFSTQLFLKLLAILVLIHAVEAANGWAAVPALFSTAEPLGLQILMVAGIAVVGLLISSALVALLAGGADRWSWRRQPLPAGMRTLAVVAVAALAAGVLAFGAWLRSAGPPEWPPLGAAASYVPVAATALQPLAGYLMRTVVLMVLLVGMDRFTQAWTRRHWLAGALLVLSPIVLTSPGGQDGLARWGLAALAEGGVLLVVYLAALRVDLTLLPLAAGTLAVLSMIREGVVRAHPGALPGAAIAVLLLIALAWWWQAQMQAGDPRV